MNPDKVIDTYRLARAHAWSYRLGEYETAALKDLQRVVKKSQAQIVEWFGKGLGRGDKYTREHFQGVLKEMERVSMALQAQLGEQLTNSSSRIGSLALKEWSENMSVGGIASGVNTVALSPEQFRAFFEKNPPMGLAIPKAMRAGFDHGVIQRMEGEMLDQLRMGSLGGQSYDRIVNTLESAFTDFSRRELSTITRTYFQTVNAQAFEAVYDANQDVLEGKIWTVSGDDRVCILCLPLSETLYRKGEEHPEMPRHYNCRCVFRFKTVSFRSLGLDIDELEPIEKAVVTRGYEKDGKWVIPAVGTGGARVRSISFHEDGIKGAFPNMPEAQQKAMLGAKRFEMYKAGQIGLDDLVDKRTGALFLLDELKAGSV